MPKIMLKKYLTNKNSAAFTLIELLVVIAIIGLLSSIIMASLTSARNKASVAAGLQFDDHNYQAYGADALAVYNFNEPTGSALDTSGNNLNLAPSAGLFTRVANTPNRTGKALSVAATNYAAYGTASTPKILSTNGSYTLSYWIYFNNLGCGDGCTLVAAENDNLADPSPLILLSYYGNDGFAHCYSGLLGGLDVNTVNLQTKQWYQITCSLDAPSGTLSLYLNGKFIDSQSVTSVPDIGIDHVFVGADSGSAFGSNTALDAYITNVRIYQHSIGGK